MSEELDFDSLTTIEIPVSYAGKKYLLREANEAAAAVFQNARMRGAQMEGDKVTQLPEDLAGMRSLLLSHCLYLCNEQGVGTSLVPQTVIQSWPSRVVAPLFEKVKEISELDEGDLESLIKQRDKLNEQIIKLQKDAAKNESSDTVDG